jgi:hypothetical protein
MARISVESAVFYALIGITAHSGWNASSAATTTPVPLAASPAQAFAGTSSINNIRIGVHPGKMRIVLDISQPTEMGFEASDDGKSVIVKLPASVWRAGAFSARHARGMLTDFLYTPSESGGGQLSLFMNRPVRIERPFLVPPGGKRGHRMVIDIAPASAETVAAPENNRHQKNRHPAIRPAAFQSRPAPGQTASSPNSRPHQLVGLWTDANQQLPPETVQLAAFETAQTRFPAPRQPYPVPPRHRNLSTARASAWPTAGADISGASARRRLSPASTGADISRPSSSAVLPRPSSGGRHLAAATDPVAGSGIGDDRKTVLCAGPVRRHIRP